MNMRGPARPELATYSGTLRGLMDDVDEAWPEGLPPEIVFVRVDLGGQQYVVERVELTAPTEGETIVLHIREVNDND